MTKYVLVDWEADHSVSVIPSSKLKYRDGVNVVQKWPDGNYRGVILEESGKLHVWLECAWETEREIRLHWWWETPLPVKSKVVRICSIEIDEVCFPQTTKRSWKSGRRSSAGKPALQRESLLQQDLPLKSRKHQQRCKERNPRKDLQKKIWNNWLALHLKNSKGLPKYIEHTRRLSGCSDKRVQEKRAQ